MARLHTPIRIGAATIRNRLYRAPVLEGAGSGDDAADVYARHFVANAKSEWQTYGSVFWANAPLLDGDVIYARDVGEESNRELALAFPDRAVYRLSGLGLLPYRPGDG